MARRGALLHHAGGSGGWLQRSLHNCCSPGESLAPSPVGADDGGVLERRVPS